MIIISQPPRCVCFYLYVKRPVFYCFKQFLNNDTKRLQKNWCRVGKDATYVHTVQTCTKVRREKISFIILLSYCLIVGANWIVKLHLKLCCTYFHLHKRKFSSCIASWHHIVGSQIDFKRGETSTKYSDVDKGNWLTLFDNVSVVKVLSWKWKPEIKYVDELTPWPAPLCNLMKFKLHSDAIWMVTENLSTERNCK